MNGQGEAGRAVPVPQARRRQLNPPENLPALPLSRSRARLRHQSVQTDVQLLQGQRRDHDFYGEHALNRGGALNKQLLGQLLHQLGQTLMGGRAHDAQVDAQLLEVRRERRVGLEHVG